MKLRQVWVYSGIEIGLKLLGHLLVVKLVATYHGAEGLAKFSQFQNIFMAATSFVVGGFVTGLVRSIAQDDANTLRYMQSAISLGFVKSILASLVLALVLFRYVGPWMDAGAGFYIFATAALLSLPCAMIFHVLSAYFNGARLIRELMLQRYSLALATIIFAFPLVYFFGLAGGLASVYLPFVVGALIALYVAAKRGRSTREWFRLRFHAKEAWELMGFWLMAMVTIISTPVLLISIRTYLLKHGGWEIAGLWEAMWRLSELTLLLVTSAFVIYYVPMLSQARRLREENALIVKVLGLVLLVGSLFTIVFIGLRLPLIRLMYSEEFLVIHDPLLYQLLGGLLRVVVWVFALHMLVKAKVWIFVVSELSIAIVVFCSSIYFFERDGLEGLALSFLLTGVAALGYYLIYYLLYSTKNAFRREIFLP